MLLLQAFSGLAQLFFPVAILAVFYFFLIRPEQNKKKKQSDFVNNLKKGQRVVTVGGVHGKIVNIEKTIVTLDVDRGTKIQVDRNSVSLEMTNSKN
jgi:preprotein translocase subunit YajC|tara:strand:+ start:301 stop:588 length:288 start_codon:yes stop_codon:yes gene_type:complete